MKDVRKKNKIIFEKGIDIYCWERYKTGYNMMRTVMGTIDEDDEKVYQMIQDLKGDDAPDLR